jgi:hypothetical protein
LAQTEVGKGHEDESHENDGHKIEVWGPGGASRLRVVSSQDTGPRNILFLGLEALPEAGTFWSMDPRCAGKLAGLFRMEVQVNEWAGCFQKVASKVASKVE